ncbi:MAG: hypothetical protein COX07_06075 [Bacteroidetes bacterium CG23_combo_of_CG06-09_8_20_14_all_32_9]|nr:MAG: hypothetical protein COX07_06075 [Bacteroidetes bacterium CG23_combo_of_CG06-09_8_20_14_all_32_9]
MKKFLYFIVLVLFISACTKGHRCDCFVSNGKVIEEQRNLSSFTEIEINNVFNVTFKIDTVNAITITTGKNLINGIETKVENNRLYVKNTNRCNWTRKYKGKIKLEIAFNKLTYLKLNGSCDVNCLDTIKGNEIRIDDWADISTFNLIVNYSTLTFALHAGTGDISLKGKVGVGYYWNNGYGYFHFNDLPTDYCYIMSNSTGDCNIFVNKEIGAKLYNSGNIYMYGNPEHITSSQYGSGQLVRE